ncbi:DUF3592 domain-containing protein, partial [bacterium]
WPSAPCHIISSVLKSHSGSDSTTYSADIRYSYSVGGKTYESERDSFADYGSSSNYSSHQAMVSRYPAGSNSVCYYNPADPTSAVLDRGWTGDLWMGLVSLPFLLVGLGGMIGFTRSGGNSPVPRAPWRPSVATITSSGAVVLKPTSSPAGRFIGLGLVSAFWNGIVWLGFVRNISTSGSGLPIFFILFLLPFIAIGALLFYTWLQAGLALANAKPVLTLSRGNLRVGESAELHFQLSGGFMPTHLEIVLEGREEAQFRRGTDTITDKSTFYLQTITQTAERSGSCTVSIPPNTMHSFESRNNKILWILRATGPIPRWPDISEEWKITVDPGR